MAVVSAPAPPVAPAATPTDEDLLRRFSAGDGVAFDELFRRHCGRAYRVAYRLLGNEADALDAVQDGFVKVLTNLRGFAGRSSFKTWLLRIVSNAALDLGRKRQVRAASPDEHRNSDETSPVTWDDPARGMVNGELRQAITAALARLPEAQRQTFVLHTEGEMSYQEVADVLGISVGTVMSRLFYTRQKLRGYLSHLMP